MPIDGEGECLDSLLHCTTSTWQPVRRGLVAWQLCQGVMVIVRGKSNGQ